MSRLAATRPALASLTILALLAACDAPAPLAPTATPRAALRADAGTTGAHSVVSFNPETITFGPSDCIPEAVTVTGTSHDVFQYTQTASGRSDIRFNSHLQQASAVGATTGTQYKVISVQNSDMTFTAWPESPFTFVSTTKIIAPGGTSYSIKLLTSYHVNANGTVTADVNTERATCH